MSNSCFNSNQARGGNKSWGPPSDPVGTPFLFDLDKDPQELQSVHAKAEYAGIQESLERELKRLRAHYRVPDPDPADTYPRKKRKQR